MYVNQKIEQAGFRIVFPACSLRTDPAAMIDLMT
jgi:tRNA A37 threonylcarbamoyltransferase TsaD